MLARVRQTVRVPVARLVPMWIVPRSRSPSIAIVMWMMMVQRVWTVLLLLLLHCSHSDISPHLTSAFLVSLHATFVTRESSREALGSLSTRQLVSHDPLCYGSGETNGTLLTSLHTQYYLIRYFTSVTSFTQHQTKISEHTMALLIAKKQIYFLFSFDLRFIKFTSSIEETLPTFRWLRVR